MSPIVPHANYRHGLAKGHLGIIRHVEARGYYVREHDALFYADVIRQMGHVAIGTSHGRNQ
jgi:cysteine sulfinate desulfinase/cysteine desulfurase-like protein